MRRKDGTQQDIARQIYAREKGSLAQKGRNFHVRRATPPPQPPLQHGGLTPRLALRRKKAVEGRSNQFIFRDTLFFGIPLLLGCFCFHLLQGVSLKCSGKQSDFPE